MSQALWTWLLPNAATNTIPSNIHSQPSNKQVQKMVGKRPRKVAFAVTTSPPPSPKDHSKADERSLLTDGTTTTEVTAFNLHDTVTTGDKLTDEDGVIPSRLVALVGAESESENGESESSDEDGSRRAARARERARIAEERRIDEEGSDWEVVQGETKRKRTEMAVGDAVGGLAERLEDGESVERAVRRAGREGGGVNVERVTELAQVLVEDGVDKVYGMDVGEMVGICEWWELRWDGGECVGRFKVEDMRIWGRAGYFCQKGRKAEVRGGDGVMWWLAERLFRR